MRYCHSTSSANSAWARQFLLIVALCAFASWPALAQTSDTVTLGQHVPMKVENGSATLVGHYNPNQMLRLGLAVQAPHMAEEEQFIQELITKGSPNFHKFLTADEWNARFAPAAEDEQAVVDWAKSQGLTVTNRYADRLMVDVEAPSGVIEKAFGVTLNNYQVGDEVDFSNDRNPSIPASLSGILHTVLGLNNVERVHRVGASKSTTKGADYVPGPIYSEGESMHLDGDPTKAPASLALANQAGGSAPSPIPSDSYPLREIDGTYAANPSNIQSSEGYDYNALQRLSHCCNVHNDSTGSPAVSSIALVGYGGFSNTDVTTFFEYYGMAANINAYCIGGSPCPAVDGEAPLDVEYSGAMSNSYGSYLDTAHIYEYEMTNNAYTTYYDTFEDIKSDNHAKVVSTSYGFVENVGFAGSYATGTMHPLFNTMLGEGWTLIAASGDNGASDGCGDATAVDYPSSDPDFVAAGGTQLLLNDSGIYVSEIGWQGEFGTSGKGSCATNHGGSTGGVSVLFGAPPWQSTLVSPYYEYKGSTKYVVTGNTNRLVPDMALTANPDVMGEWYYSGGSWQSEGGTSIVAPELAGFFAQENTYLNYIGDICGSDGTTACTPIGYAPQWIYYTILPGDGAPHNPFYDILSGCNNNNDTVFWNLYYFCAAKGFDLVTGWGSANMLQLAWGINWQMIPGDGLPIITYSGPAINKWYNSNQQVDWTVTDSTSNTFPATGVAGFTQGWDSIPSDPTSEPHGGEGNSFYSGPEYAFGKTGCLSFVADACSGGVSQGCHTVYVEAWDNQGRNATKTYGPLCYDTVAPVATAAVSGTKVGSYYENLASVTLSASDPSPGSGVANIFYQVNGGTWLTYSVAFLVGKNGANTVKYYATDIAGNVEATKTLTFGITDGTTTSFKSSVNPSGFGKPVTFTADVTAVSGLATGSVTFKNGATVLGTVALSGGVATFTTSALPVGSDSITADFLGSTYFLASVSPAQTQVVKNDSTTVVTSSANPSKWDETVTLTATITHTATPVPTGTVIFMNGMVTLGTVTVSGGKATFSTAALAVGTHSITAVYSGSSNYMGSTSAALSQVVDKAATATTVVSSANPSHFGQSVTFTTTVKAVAPGAGTPTGTVNFNNGATLLGSATLSGGAAAFATAALAPGTHSITVVYVASTDYATSTSAALSEVVDKANTTTTLVSSANPSHFGQTVTFTATVKVVAPGTGTPVGTVQFKNGATVMGTGTLSAGKATFATATLAVGTHSITAEYVASTDYSTSTSAAVSEVVDEASTKTTIASSLNPSTSGTTVTFTATVTAVAPGVGTPAGTVTFKNGTTTLGSGTLSAGKATFATSTLAEGTDSITAVYGGNSDFTTSTSGVLSQKVNP
jgi:hypothetical protein